ncbi:hypothetical protein [Micromonospora sp. CB01531]|uniref:hypothetical protein n=1 Tax=Micromonospora sp. CB01531 TaxID=1718947 RepID=UPI001300CB00|nr:hypothetical protein [Micromonospora sp. CB01531]
MKILVEIPDRYWVARRIYSGVKLDIRGVIDESVWPEYGDAYLIGEVLEVVRDEDPR